MTYVPGDNWCICDLSGKKVLMSQTLKTWDGLRVWTPLWYARNPQDYLKGIPDRMAVWDARPRPADLYQTPAYGPTDFCLKSPDGSTYIVHLADDGAMLVTPGTWGMPQPKLELVPGYIFTVDNDGALHVSVAPVKKVDPPWRMVSPSGIVFEVTVDPDLAVIITRAVSFPPFMEGVFTLVSPHGVSYVVYIIDDMAVMVNHYLGEWGPKSTHRYIDEHVLSVDDDGALLSRPSGEKWPPSYRMVSTGGYEYMWHIDPDGAVKIERQGHFWDVPVLVVQKPIPIPTVSSGTMDTTDAVAESGQDVWVEE